jgi:uncharacterized membrane protein
MGPVEYLIVRFPGYRFHADVAMALQELVDTGLVNIIDLVFVIKDENGKVEWLELDGLDHELTEAFQNVRGEYGGLLNDEDVQLAAESLTPNSSAGILVFENAWAARFAAAVRDSGGEVVANARIPRQVVDAAVAALAQPQPQPQ